MNWKTDDAVTECLESGFILHSHIPKTAGTSLLRGFQEIIRPDQFMHWNPSNPYNLERSIEELKAILAKNSYLKIITGHFTYGVHNALKGKPYKYVTILRDPVERVFSHYKHALQNNLHTMSEEQGQAFIDLEIQEIIRLPGISYFYNNLQSRFISGLTEADFDGRSDTEVLEVCKKNIFNDYCYIGSQSSMSAVIQDLADLLNLTGLSERRENSRGLIDPRTALAPNQVSDILDQNKKDTLLVKEFIPESTSINSSYSFEAAGSEIMLRSYKKALKLLLRRVIRLQNHRNV